MSFATTVQNESAIINVPSRFDFKRTGDFLAAAGGVLEQASCSQIVIDFGATEYMDSASLGTLLVMRDRARGSGKSVVLSGARGAVREILKIANFEKLFAFR